MAELSLNGAGLGNDLMRVMMHDQIAPGDDASYQTCKTLYLYHPLGRKLVELPIEMAQSQEREITIADGPEEECKKAFLDDWYQLDANKIIFNIFRVSRIYGISAAAIIVNGDKPDAPLDLTKLYNADISFSVFDPLNTSGSLTYNQNPNASDFMKTKGNLVVQNVIYDKTRCVVQLNEEPIYLAWTSSTFGFTGRSVYQRALFLLKSFLQTMITDDMVAKKAGLLVAKMEEPGSVVTNVMKKLAAAKRNFLKIGQTDNVLSIGIKEDVNAIDLTNVNAAMSESRKNILNNIASSSGMPSILMNEETFAEGFGEGTEDAKHVARFIEEFRKDMRHVYEFFDQIVQYRAWNKDWYKSIQEKYPETYGNVEYKVAFAQFRKSFEAPWPSLLVEPDSEKSKADKVKLDAVIELAELFLPMVDPENKAILAQWSQDNFNALEKLFSSPLMMNMESLKNYVPPVPGMDGEGEPGDGDSPNKPSPKAGSASKSRHDAARADVAEVTIAGLKARLAKRKGPRNG